MRSVIVEETDRTSSRFPNADFYVEDNGALRITRKMGVFIDTFAVFASGCWTSVRYQDDEVAK